MSKTHEYPVTLDWRGGRDGSGTVRSDRSGFSTALSIPSEFGGSGAAGTNPEELLTSSIVACYSMTFGIIAVNRKLPFVGMDVDAVGEVEESGPQFSYKKVTIRAKVRLDAGATDEQVKVAEDMAHKADAYCIVTNAVRERVEIVIEPNIVRG